MKIINNKNGIKMYWERAKDIDKINIYDSNKKYFNDLYIDNKKDKDITDIIKTLEETTLEDMCDFFDTKLYHSLDAVSFEEDVSFEDLKNNEYLNEFKVYKTTYYTWSW